MGDHVDRMVEQWARERPELDVEANALLARLLRAARFLELRMAEVFARKGLGRGEFDVLASLRRSGPPFALTPTRLSEGLLLSTSALRCGVGLSGSAPTTSSRPGMSRPYTIRRTLAQYVVPAHIAHGSALEYIVQRAR